MWFSKTQNTLQVTWFRTRLEESHLRPLALLVVQADHDLDGPPLLPAPPPLAAGVVQEHVCRETEQQAGGQTADKSMLKMCCWENMVSFVSMLDYRGTLIGEELRDPIVLLV